MSNLHILMWFFFFQAQNDQFSSVFNLEDYKGTLHYIKFPLLNINY